jgi:hypothetical protein
MEALTFPEIITMDEVVSDLRCLRLAFNQKQMEYAKAGLIASNAWLAFGEAIDAEMPAAEINRLGDIAELADTLKRQAGREFDEVKAALIAREQ